MNLKSYFLTVSIVSITILMVSCSTVKPEPLILPEPVPQQPTYAPLPLSPAIINSLADIKPANVQGESKFFAKNSFDISYSGSITDLLSYLQQYDDSLRILPPLGKIKDINVNIILPNVTIEDVSDAVKVQTNNQVKLFYSRRHNYVRLIYTSSISLAKSALNQSLAWQNGKTPLPVLDKDGIVLFPFGQYEPTITCQTMQLCDIELEAGENVQGFVIGDDVRWITSASKMITSGIGNQQITHIILKPKYAGLDTSLIITTDKRTYYIKLISSDRENLSHVGFYYPDEEIANMQLAIAKAKAQDNTILSDSEMPSITPQDLNFDYKVTGDDDIDFKPNQVFDDGTHTYIRLNEDIHASDLPVIYTPNGDVLELVNFRWKAPYYIVDKIFRKAVLILGVGREREKVFIDREN